MERISFYGFLLIVLAGMLCFSFPGSAQGTGSLEIVRRNIMKQYLEGLNRSRLDKATTKWMQELSRDGSWPDIDYDSRERGIWPPGQHFERIRRMAAAYMLKDGPRYGKQLLEADKPCIVMVRDISGKSPLVYVADPTQKLTRINIRLGRGDGRPPIAWPVDLPTGKMAGKTVAATVLAH